MATRCICPPDSCVARLASFSSMWSSRAISRTRAATSASAMRRAGERSGKARLSNTDRCG